VRFGLSNYAGRRTAKELQQNYLGKHRESVRKVGAEEQVEYKKVP